MLQTTVTRKPSKGKRATAVRVRRPLATSKEIYSKLTICDFLVL